MASRNRKDRKGRAYGGGRGGPGCMSFIFLAFLILAAVGATVAIFFRINTIEVNGAERYTPDEVRTASGVQTGNNLLIFNKFGAISGIFAKLPYMNEVRISRQLPDTLVIHVTEYKAAAYIRSGSAFWLLSQDGKLLEQKADISGEPALIEVQGAELVSPTVGEKAVLRDTGGTQKDGTLIADTMTEALTAIADGGIKGDVSLLNVQKIYNVTFRYLGRFDVKLGMPDHLGYKMNYLKEIVGQLEPNETGVIDLSELIEKEVARFIPAAG